MAKISLTTKLQVEKVLKSGLVVSSTLVDRLEVYGYLNSCDGEDIIKNSRYNNFINGKYNNFINVQTVGETICAGYLMQPAIVSDIYGRSKFETKMHQVYSTLELAKEEIKYDLANLDIPSLYYNLVYVGIRKKIQIDCPDYQIKNWVWMFPDNIKKKSDASLGFDYISKVGEILCRDKSGTVKGIGEHLMALCRYLAPQTGLMCYAQFELDELYVEEEK